MTNQTPARNDLQDAKRPVKTRHKKSLWPRVLLYIFVSGLFLVLPVIVMLGLMATDTGYRFIIDKLSAVPGLNLDIEGASGDLLNRPGFRKLTFDNDSIHLEMHGLVLNWQPSELLQWRLHIVSAHLDSFKLELKPTPPSPKKAPKSLVLPFWVIVDQLSADHAAIYHQTHEDKKSLELLLELSNIRCRAFADTQRYTVPACSLNSNYGQLSASGSMAMRSPFALDAKLDANVNYENRKLDVQARITDNLLLPRVLLDTEAEGVAAKLDAIVDPFSALPVRSALVKLNHINPAGFSAQLPQALLNADIDFRARLADGLQLKAGETLVTDPLKIQISGPVLITNLSPKAYSDGGIPVRQLKAQLAWKNSRLDVSDLFIDLLAGTVKGRFGIMPNSKLSALQSFTAGLDFAQINLQALDKRLPVSSLLGSIKSDGDISKQNFLVNLSEQGALLLVEGWHFDNKLHFNQLALNKNDAKFSGHGDVDLRASQLQASFEASKFNPQLFLTSAPVADINLKANVSGDFRASNIASPLMVNFEMAPSVVAGRAMLGSGKLAYTSQRLSNTDIKIDVGGNLLAAQGSLGGVGDSMKIDFNGKKLSALQEGLDGTITALVTLSGTLTTPSGEATIAALDLQLPDKTKIASINLQGKLEKGLDGKFLLGGAVGEITNAQKKTIADYAAIGIEGTRLEHTMFLNTSFGDDLAFEGMLKGGLRSAPPGSNKLPFWSGKVTTLAIRGQAALELTEPADINFGATGVHLGKARLKARTGFVNVDQLDWQEGQTITKGTISDVTLGLVRNENGNFASQKGELQLSGEWDIKLAEEATGFVRIKRDAGDLLLPGDVPIRLGLNQLELVVAAGGDRVAWSIDAQGAQIGVVAGTGSAPLRRVGKGWALDENGQILGSVNIDMPSTAWIGSLIGPNWLMQGQVDADFTLSGTMKNPQSSGMVKGRKLGIYLADQGLRLANGSFDANFSGDRFTLEKLQFTSSSSTRPKYKDIPYTDLTTKPGTLIGSGSLALQSGVGHFSFVADRMVLFDRNDRWMAVSGKGESSSSLAGIRLNADIGLDAAYVEMSESQAPSLSSDVVMVQKKVAPSKASSPFNAKIKIAMGRRFYVNALGLKTRLSGGLNITAQSNQPMKAVGTIQTRGGVFRGYGQDLSIDRGLVNFQGPLENPGLNILALRKGLEVEAGVSISGTARKPEIKLVSIPEVPDNVKLSWIVLGRGPDDNSQGDLSLLLSAAKALIGDDSVAGTVQSSLGIDQFGISRGDLSGSTRAPTSQVVDAGNTSRSDARSSEILTVGKRLSNNLFVSFEQNLASAEYIIKLSYQITRQLSMVLRGGSDNALDMNYSVSFY